MSQSRSERPVARWITACRKTGVRPGHKNGKMLRKSYKCVHCSSNIDNRQGFHRLPCRIHIVQLSAHRNVLSSEVSFFRRSKVLFMFRFFRVVSIMTLLVYFSIDLQSQPKNHAALIGVGAYPASTGWAPLVSGNDMELISLTLQDVGFAAEDIQILQDEDATRAGIESFLRDRIAPELKKGDLLVLHFSGHGQQAADDNGDEEDSLDECWVPFDSPKNFQAGIYEGENLLRDDIIGEILDVLLDKVGENGHIFLSVDACHSGTSTRGLGTARGTDVIMADPSVQREGLFTAKRNQPASDPELVTTPHRENLVVFTSSSPAQLSYEEPRANGVFGAYTYELCRSLRTLDAKASIRDLYNDIQNKIQNLNLSQRPTAEGNLDRLVFAGRLTPPVPAFRIIKPLAPDTMFLAAGSLKGVFPGSLMAIYPAGTADTATATPVAIGQVTEAEAITSVLALTTSISALATKNTRAYLTYAAPPPIDISIHLLKLESVSDQRIRTALKEYPFIRIVDLPARLIVEDERDSLFLWTPDDRLIWSDGIKANNGFKLVQAIKQHVEATALRQMESADPAYSADLDLLIQTDKGWEVFTEETALEGNKVRLQIVNTGTKAFIIHLWISSRMTRYLRLSLQPGRMVKHTIWSRVKIGRVSHLRSHLLTAQNQSN